ncbi:immunoglobulin lambda-1 light chain-like [Protopterus annectens]|uniref:immunoglobulin lambda-1 light chain-like n=1 Tax=Protopterus annectens TaxID=7888 RepID=UPI001CFAC254|nr:immunoglobulin lambda-1 light chain-like [Protopterus annectens]
MRMEKGEFAGVWGEAKITQKPTFSVKELGQAITLPCDTTGLKDNVYWLRQYKGWEIEHLLCHHKDPNKSYVPQELRSKFFPSYDTSEKKFILTIQDLRTEDSSTIFCATTSGSSKGTSLQVASSAAVNIFPIYPTLHQIQNQTTVMVGCLARSKNSDIRITWISESGLTFPPVFNKKMKSFSVTSYLTVSTTDWKRGRSYTCSVNGTQIKISMKTG